MIDERRKFMERMVMVQWMHSLKKKAVSRIIFNILKYFSEELEAIRKNYRLLIDKVEIALWFPWHFEIATTDQSEKKSVKVIYCEIWMDKCNWNRHLFGSCQRQQ